MAELGVAYISIVPEMRGMKPAIAKAFQGVDAEGAKAGKTVGSAFTDGVDSQTKKGQKSTVARSFQGTEVEGAKAGKAVGSAFSNEVEKETAGAGKKASGAFSKVFSGAGFGAVAGVAASATTALLGSFSELASGAAKASDATDKFKQTLNFAGLDTSAIEKATKDAQRYADQTVYELGDIQNMTAQLAANGIKDYTGLAEAAGNLNAVAGGNADTFKSVGMVMTQTAGAGKLTTENWNQLSDAIPGASGKIQEALQQAGAYTGNFRDAMAKGEITAEEFNDAVMKLGSEPIAVEAAKSTQTFEGMLGNLQATIEGGLANAFNILKPHIETFVNVLSRAAELVLPLLANGLTAVLTVLKPIAPVLGIAAGALAAFAATATIMNAGGLIAWFKELTVVTKLQALATNIATGAQVAFKAVMAGNPVAWAIIGITALVTGLTLFFTKTEAGRKAWGQLVDSFKAGWEKISGVLKNIKDAFGELGQIFSGKELETDLNALTKIFGEDMAVSIGNFVIDVRDKFNQVKDAVKEFWGMLKGDEMAEGWPNLADLLGVDNAEKLFDFAGKAREAFGQIKDAGGELFAAFQGKDMGFGALSELFGEEFGKKIADGFAVAGEKVREFWDKITHFDLSSLTTALGPLADFLGDSFKGTWDSLKDSMGSILSIVVELSTSLGGAFFGILKGVWGLLKGLWDVIGPLLLPALKIIGAVVGGVLIGAFIAFAKTLEGVAWGISKLLQGIEWVAKNIGGPLIGAIGTAAEWIGSKLGGAFSTAKDWAIDAWRIIGDSFTKGKDFIGTAIDWIKDKWQALSNGFKTVWEGFIKPVWDGMVQAGQVLAAIIGTAVLTPIMIGWNNLSTLIKAAWETIIKPAWDAIAAAGQWLWNEVLMPAFDGIKQGWQTLVDGIKWAWENLLKPAWDALGAAANWLWQTVLVPVFDGIKWAWEMLVEGIRVVWESVLKPIWDAVAAAANWLWQNVLVPAFDGIKAAWQWLVDALNAAWQWLKTNVFDVFMSVVEQVRAWFEEKINQIAAAWDWMKQQLHAGWQWIDANVFNPIREGLDRVKGFFDNAVEGIKSVWDSLRSALAKPINFMINTVYNGGIKKAWDTMSGFLPGINPAPAMSGIPEYATGGRIRGKGTGTSDDVLMWGSNGEHMITAKEVERAGGHNAIYFMRDLIASGTPFKWDGGKFIAENRKSVDAFGAAVARKGIGHVSDNGLYSMLPKYKDGGEIRPMWELQLENGHRAAKMRDGHPYTWGNEDCSGYMSMIGDAIVNGGDGQRKWATGSFPGGQPFVPGLGAGFSVGVHDNPGGPGGGHTAGTLTGVGPYSTVNVESGGGHGYVAYGGPAAGADSSQFVGVQPGQYHLAIGADGAFEPGGPGGGPSPEKMLSAIMEKIQWVTDKAMSPIKSMLPGKPPEWNQVPTSVWEKGKELVPEGAKAIAGNLGDKLRTVYSALGGVKDLIGEKAQDAGEFVNRQAARALRTVGLYDNGGWLMPDSLAVNRTGKPEPIMNDWQWRLFKALPPALVQLVPPLQKWVDDGIDQLEHFANNFGEAAEQFNQTMGKQIEESGKQWVTDTAKSSLGFFGLDPLVDIGQSLWSRFEPAVREEIALRNGTAEPQSGVSAYAEPTTPPIPTQSVPTPVVDTPADAAAAAKSSGERIVIEINATGGDFVHVDDLEKLQDQVDGLEVKVNGRAPAAATTRGGVM